MDPSRPDDARLARRGLRLAALGTASTALAALAIAQTDLEAAAEVARRADPVRLLAGCASMTLGLLFLAARWRALMPTTARVQLGPLTAMLVTGTLLNFALPGPVGEFVAAGMAARRWGMTPEQAFAAGVHARFIGLALAGVVALILFLTTDLPVPPEYHTGVGLATAVVALAAGVLFVLSSTPGLLKAAGRWAFAVPVWPARLRAALEPRVAQLADALAAVGHLGARRYAAAALWALGGHLCVACGVGVVAWGLGTAPDPTGLAFTYAMTTAGAVVLFAFPGSQVGWDALLSGLLHMAAGIPLAAAVGVAVVVRTQQLFVVLLGAVALVSDPAARGPDAASGSDAA